MGRIIVLDENTSNKIAAGEVVEKPASVVKELVENSIDAGATSISVDIRNGGISYIKVTDNGGGMEEDDVELAFERHATSKIKRAEDLDSIITMGFRGEALASIAAVSSVELQTKTASSTYGMYVNIVGGVTKEVRQTGCPVGTTFIIKDLFFNTPARYKFLKKDSTETGYISDTMSRIALGNPEVAFKLTSGKTLLFHSPGNNDLKSTIFSVYGKEIIKDLLEVNYQDEKFRIVGYVGKPEAARANRNYQSLYINKRYIKSKLVSYSVEQAFSSILMKNKFPFFVLNIELNPQQVDANVHPAKMDVRFADESYLTRAIYMAVSKALSSGELFNPVTVTNKDREIFKFKNSINTGSEHVQETIAFSTAGDKNTNATSSSVSLINKSEDYEVATKSDIKANSVFGKSSAIYEKKDAEEKTLEEIRLFTKALEPLARTDVYKDISNYEITENSDKNRTSITNRTENKESIFWQEASNSARHGIEQEDIDAQHNKEKIYTNEEPNQLENAYADIDKEVKITEKLDEKATTSNQNYDENEDIQKTGKSKSTSELLDMKYIGQAFSTYLLLQNGEELVLIDQHAAHERILYEKLKVKYEQQENNTQLLLEPIVIQLQPNELNLIRTKQELISRIGFEFEDFGNNSIIIRGIPYLVEAYSPRDIFFELTEKLQDSVKPVSTPLADEIIHTLACKAAVKANKKLDDREVKQLLYELSNTGSRYTCPHGRPTVIRLTKYEIEKMFKRIV